MSKSPKSWFEILITPIVVAFIGVYGTYTITESQIDNARETSKTQLRIQAKEARNNRKLKTLEIFSNHIMSKNVEERLLALGLVNLLEPDLAVNMINYLASHDQDERVKTKAKIIQEEIYKKAKHIGYGSIEERVKRVLAKLYRVSYSDITKKSVLAEINPDRNMAGVGDITSVEALIELEEEFSCKVDDEIAEEMETVSDMVAVFKSCFSDTEKSISSTE